VALLTGVMAMVMMLAIAAGITLSTMTEATIAANHRDAIQALYAAEAGIELTISRLRTMPDWSPTAIQAVGTPFVQGALVDLLQGAAPDPRVTVAVSVSPDPAGAQDVLVLQSTGSDPSGIRRGIQVTIRRESAVEGATARKIDRLSWRER